MNILVSLQNFSDSLRVNANAVWTGSTTSWELLKYEKERRKIVTYCSELDKILGGGICSKEVTEICEFLA